jgi:hypothetical protein
MPNACEIDVPEQEYNESSDSVPEGLPVAGCLSPDNAALESLTFSEKLPSVKKSPPPLVTKNRPPPKSFADKNHQIAKNLHEAAYIYALYGMLDGLSLSYSMIKYCFDLLHKDSPLSSTDEMHNWMITPAGIAVAAIESVSLIAFAMLANFFNDKSKSALKRYIAFIWPYCRDLLQGLKNAYKGVRGALQALTTLVGQDLRYLMVPFGLALGAISVMNRIWLRRMRADRKVMQADNADLLREIQATCSLHLMTSMPADDDLKNYKNSYIFVGQDLVYVKPDGLKEEVHLQDVEKFSKDVDAKNKDKKLKLFLDKKLTDALITSNGGHKPTFAFVTDADCEAFANKKIGRQSTRLRTLGLLSAAYNGVADGIYLYMGALGLTVLAPPVFIVMFTFSALFTLTCIATRMYEEYDYQRKLVATSAQVELAICGKQLELLFSKLQQLSERRLPEPHLPGYASPDSSASEETLTEDEKQMMVLFGEKKDEFDRRHAFFRSQHTLSHHSAILAGLQNGLAAYSAIASVMFAVAAICFIASAPFPPAFLVVCIAAGMACLIGFVAHALITNYVHRNAQTPKEIESKTKLSNLLAEMKKDCLVVANLEPANIKDAISDRIAVDPSPQFYIQESCEMLRAAASGLSKAPKVVGYALNQLQESDSQGHYHDTTIMVWITGVSAAIYAVVLALRAYARGFNQKKEIIAEVTPKAAAAMAPNGSKLLQSSLYSPEQSLAMPAELLEKSEQSPGPSRRPLEIVPVRGAPGGREGSGFFSLSIDGQARPTADSLPAFRPSPGHTPVGTKAQFRFFSSSSPTSPSPTPPPICRSPSPRPSTSSGIQTSFDTPAPLMRSTSAGNLSDFNSSESTTQDLMKGHYTF